MRKSNKQVQNERDNKILDFLDKFQAAKTDTIHELFFTKEDGTHTSLRVAQNALQRLDEEENRIKRDRENVIEQYYCYLPKRKPTSQLRHTLITTDFIKELSRLKDVTIHGYYKPIISKFKPDLIVAFQIGDSDLILVYVEVEISKKKIDIDKYIECRRKRLYEAIGVDEMPTLVVVTNKKKMPQTHGINIIKIKTDLSDINQIYKLKGDI